MYPIRTGKEFLERGYPVYGLCTSGTQVAQGMRDFGIEAFEVSSKGKLISNQLFQLEKWLSQRNISIVHCHKSGDILVSALLNCISRRKTFFTEHMGVTRSKKDIYHKLIYAHIDQVFSISDETYKRNIHSLPIRVEKISRLWLGTDIPFDHSEDPKFIENIKKELDLPRNSIVIGNIGRVCSGKGQLELLEAFALLICKFPSLHLLIVGGLNTKEGSDNNFVKSLMARIEDLNLQNRVHLVGFRKDTDRMLSIMDVVCLPNHNEAFGLTAIEAMAAKKAIVAANSGSLPEVLGSTARFCNPHNPNDICSNIEFLLNHHDEKLKLSRLAYNRAKSKFSMAAHISKLEENYLN
ncbi:glycosyltransferase family 4 protein [Vibrio coralliilyticus]|nr:glycosyltransferase family 4 protein [Vibrio coralliilyticus]NRF54529.1 glycosyltransferase family 4 protein [Vibrio coralliilyticus]